MLTLSVLLAGSALAQEPVSILQKNSYAQSMPILAAPEDPGFDDPSFAELNVLTRGPMHEAFASAHQPDPQSSTLVLTTPPKLIDELPPEYKPEGNNVQWISGYWAWDDAQSDFIWISGIWRDLPQNRRWVPGYWDAEGNAHRWVAGFWIEETQNELGYLPQPPASIDQGPSTRSPSAQHFYVPGNWQFQDGRYQWLSGYWQPVVENFIWVPARYIWTPNGCVYQTGYWDYELENRGTCFAPIHFSRPVYLASNYSYRPSYAINLNVDFMTHLFVRPGCGHYFYGDWYASNFNNIGYRPWVSYTSHFRNYDPLLTYYSCRRSSFDSRYNVVQYLARQHGFYINNRDYRPRPTYTAQYKHARNFEKRPSGRGHGKDYVLRSSYVSAYKDFHKHGQGHRRQTSDFRGQPGQKGHASKKHHKVAANELRNNLRRQEQLAELQQKRQRREHTGQSRVAMSSAGKNQLQSRPSTRDLERERSRTGRDKSRHAAVNAHRSNQLGSNAQRSNSQRKRDTKSLNSSSRSVQPSKFDQALRAQQERARRSQKERERQTQQESARRSQQEAARKSAARKSQQDSARRAQQEQARRIQQNNVRRAQQQGSRVSITGNTSGKMRMQNIPSIKQREQAARQAQQESARRAQQQQARRAQQDQARKAQQDAARKAQQDKARRIQQDRDRQQASQRARQQQQAQRDSAARKARQKAQQNTARQAEKTRQASKPKAPQESRSSRLRNRSKRK